MKDLAIAIRIGNPSSEINLVRKTLVSFEKNMGNCDWKTYISIGTKIPLELKDYVVDYVSKHPDHFIIFQIEEVYWSDFINKAIDITTDYQYFAIAHDDIELITPEFFNSIKSFIKEINKEIGWISVTDIGWKLGNFVPPSRDGYYIDSRYEESWQTKKIFQYHLFPKYWPKANFVLHWIYLFKYKYHLVYKTKEPNYPKPIKRIQKYLVDMPQKPVKTHASYNCFTLIKRSVLDKIGKCECWETKSALIVDEDWGLRTLLLNIPNVWVPEIEIIHHQKNQMGGGTRSWEFISKDAKRVNELFFEKWGFHPTPSEEELKFIQFKFKDTLIPWSSYRRSWEWDYDI